MLPRFGQSVEEQLVIDIEIEEMFLEFEELDALVVGGKARREYAGVPSRANAAGPSIIP